MKYFNNCKTLEEVKTLYRELAKENHPDMGGDTATMQEINKEYAFACAFIAKGSGMTDEQVDQELKLSEEYRAVIEKIIHLPGITIELVGNWIWVTGDTKPVKESLKDARFIFASKKVAWFYRNEAFKVRGNGAPLEKIRAKYGSQTVQGKYKKELNEA
ncbi:hypothetical protein [Chitinophaga terrae (ex Kim and Jung 2007)]|jgi:DnaJ domain.|uniref:hypothetical protein n=1 Tax=Chitinophaga terrae (ex Kim and Jung 2007) TaxID=408074 RepID=UPI00260E3FE3|nr:hypothetical protein [Chitinophaga terrae (ex Kim and Jung 2007)]MDQ0109110.1 hypothetical protein [Chitinophaga terrae (ex Kim and Jung 2007)]